MIKLQEGKRYVTRNGEVTGPLERNHHKVSRYQFMEKLESNDYRNWTDAGHFWNNKIDHDLDIISEYQEFEADMQDDEQEIQKIPPKRVRHGTIHWDEGEPEYLTTETDAGFRAVVEYYAINGKVGIQKIGMSDRWDNVPWVDNYNDSLAGIVLCAKRKECVYRVKNPNYRPPKPEPKVGEVWLWQRPTNTFTKRILVLDLYTLAGTGYAKAWDITDKIFQAFKTEFLKEFTGKTIDLSVLEEEQ